MGRKERIKKKFVQQKQQELSKQVSDRKFLEYELLRIKSELAVKESKDREAFVKITNELAGLRRDLMLMDRVLTASKLISKEMVQEAVKQIEKENQRYFDEDGKMLGTPIITSYNCDFDIEIDEELAFVKKVNNYGL